MIILNLINYNSCVNIDGDSRVKTDLEISCYEGQHTLWSFGVALPSLIVWGIGIPLFAFILLSRASESLETLSTK